MIGWLAVQFVLVWNDAPRYLHLGADPKRYTLPEQTHELTVYRRTGESGEFVEIEPVDMSDDAHCFLGNGIGLSVRTFVQRSSIARVTTRELTVRLDGGAEAKLGAGVAVLARKAGGNEALFDDFTLTLPEVAADSLGLAYTPSPRFGRARAAIGRIHPLPPGLKASVVGLLRGLHVYAQKTRGSEVEVTAATPCAELRFVTRADHIVKGAASDIKESGVMGIPIEAGKTQTAFEIRKGARVYWQLDGTPAGSTLRAVVVPTVAKFFGRQCINEPIPVCFDPADVSKTTVRSSHPGAVFAPPIELK